MNELNRESSEPLSHQIFKILRTKILGKTWDAGELVPSEAELMQQFEVSRTTIRQALNGLVNVGLIYRQRGRGTFVAAPKIEKGLDHVVRFHEGIREQGFDFSSKLLGSGLVSPSQETADVFNLGLDEKVVTIRRLRLVKDEPMSVELSILPHRYCPGILQYDFSSSSLYEILDQEYGIRLIRGTQLIQAVLATEEFTSALNIPANSPLLYVERLSFSPQNVPVELLYTHYRGERYALRSEFVS